MTIGILGGGQLAKMLCDSAKKMKLKTIVFDPSSESCSKISADNHICESYDNQNALQEFGQQCDVITYEFENVPSETVTFLDKHFHNIPQGFNPLYISQHRIREKSAIAHLNIKTANFHSVKDQENLKQAIAIINYPAILKTCTGGYDGKGQWIINNENDLKNIILNSEQEYILEQKIPFDLEVSCLVVRNINGEVQSFPIGENIHRKGILDKTIVPARISHELENKVRKTAEQIIEGLDFVGSLGVEFFIWNQDIYVNEIAPRPHNSAHYTMDACDYSQFDLHLKSILGNPLPKPKLISSVVMCNILGEDKDKLSQINPSSQTKIHIYGKTEWKNGRKMGHINYLGNDLKELIQISNSF